MKYEIFKTVIVAKMIGERKRPSDAGPAYFRWRKRLVSLVQRKRPKSCLIGCPIDVQRDFMSGMGTYVADHPYGPEASSKDPIIMLILNFMKRMFIWKKL